MPGDSQLPSSDSKSAASGDDSQHWLLWDGECGLCSTIVDWVARQDAHARFRITPYQDAPSPPMTPALHDACAEAIHVVTRGGRTLKAGEACAFIAGNLGYRRVSRAMRTPPFSFANELAYRWVANNRPLVARLLGI